MAKKLWVKGQSGNPNGRPKSEINYNQILITKVTKEEWEAIIDKAIEQAKNGDCKAREWLTDRLLGPAKQQLELSGSINTFMLNFEDWDNDEFIDQETSPS